MHYYTIYQIKEEFAHFFYFRSDVLYRFLKSYEQGHDEELLQQQFDFITMELSEASILSYIAYFLPHHARMTRNGEAIHIDSMTHTISLHIGEKRIKFWGDIFHAAEDLLFPALRCFHPYFFVVGRQTYHFGWIAPISLGKNRDKPEQVLYSHF